MRLMLCAISVACAILLSGSATDMLSVTNPDTYVYVCGGPQSHRYHKTDKCKGLCRCSRTPFRTTQQKAESNGYKPCKICYRKRN